MFAPILTTKLYIPPPRPNLVPRPRLIERLRQGLYRKLTLVSAPAGFGKTTLVTDWLHHLERPAAWLSLDEGDNNTLRFLSYVIAALQRIEPALGKTTQSLLQDPQNFSQETVVTSLINEIAGVETSFVFVLDDYHVIETPAIDEALGFLLDHLPPQVHLVIVSRVDPSLPLPRLRARGQLTELRTDDLRFSSDEAAAFLNQVTGLDFTPADVAALEDRTEGWIAGLQLAALSMSRTTDVAGFIAAFAGSHRYIIDYLADEVLDQQPPEIRDFLLKTSILSQLCAPLCDAVMGADAKPAAGPDASSQKTLEYLEHANLFLISLDDQRRWYRYHHLFADLLQQRLHQALDFNGQLTALHRRASRWYAQQAVRADNLELADQAIQHALKAMDLAQAAQLVAQFAPPAIMQGKVTVAKNWLETLPMALIHQSVILCLAQAWIYFFTQQLEEMEAILEVAEAQLAADQAPDTPEYLGRQGEIAGLRAWVARNRGEIDQAIQLALQSLEYLPEDRVFERGLNSLFLASTLEDTGDIPSAVAILEESIKLSYAADNILAAMGATAYLADLQYIQGQLTQAKVTLLQAIDQARSEQLDTLPANAELCSMLADIFYEQNDLVAAEAYINAGLALTAHGLSTLPINAVLYLKVAWLNWAKGNLAATQAALEQVNQLHAYPSASRLIEIIMASRAELALRLGDLATAREWRQTVNLDVTEPLTYLREFELIILAQLLVVQAGAVSTPGGIRQQGLDLLARLAEFAATGGRIGRLIRILVWQAVAFHQAGELSQAVTVLGRALTLAEPEGFIRTFVDAGPVVAALLGQIPVTGSTPLYVKRLLAAFPETAAQGGPLPVTDGQGAAPRQPAPGAPPPATEALIEPLSERELEVLGLVAAGLSNKEIADQLVLAVSTVKRHMSNIYGKLGVSSRTQSLARARELGLLVD